VLEPTFRIYVLAGQPVRTVFEKVLTAVACNSEDVNYKLNLILRKVVRIYHAIACACSRSGEVGVDCAMGDDEKLSSEASFFVQVHSLSSVRIPLSTKKLNWLTRTISEKNGTNSKLGSQVYHKHTTSLCTCTVGTRFGGVERLNLQLFRS
jgi:hypothetical protein